MTQVKQPAAVADTPTVSHQQTPTRPVRRITSEAMEALAAAKKMQNLADHTEQQNDTGRFAPSVNDLNAVQNDMFEAGTADGLSIDALTGEGCGSVPFPVGR